MNNILAAVDFSDATAEVVLWATNQARAFGAKLWLIHVAPPEPDFVENQAGAQIVRDQLADQYRAEHRQLHDLGEFLKNEGVDTTPLLLHGPTAETIVREAEKLDAGIIVLGTHGHADMYRALLGSVSQRVVRSATCPVLVVPAITKKET